jgi:hypothetical protein
VCLIFCLRVAISFRKSFVESNEVPTIHSFLSAAVSHLSAFMPSTEGA